MNAEVTRTRGMLAILSGPSGVGKSTIIRRLLEDSRFALSVSATTRPPREGEVDGVDYHFLSEDEFDKRVAGGEFLEHAVVHRRHRYGTLRAEVDGLTAAGRIVILDVDVQGAAELRGEPDAVSVFIAPPDFGALERRLRGRGSEEEESIRRRLETARAELDAQDDFQHVVVNGDLGETTKKLRTLLVAEAERRTDGDDTKERS